MNIRKNRLIGFLILDILLIGIIYYWSIKSTWQQLFITELKHTEISISEYEYKIHNDSIDIITSKNKIHIDSIFIKNSCDSIEKQLYESFLLKDTEFLQWDIERLQRHTEHLQQLKEKQKHIEERNKRIENKFISWEIIRIHLANKLKKYKTYFEI